MNTPKNISASVKARLQNVAATRGEDFNLLLLRYGIERLLFRLSQSPHADRFLLKGAMLFVVWDEKTHRPTRDLDLLGLGSTEKADLIRVFAAVAAVPVVDDGIVFDPKSVQAADIREDNAYGGVRIRLLGKLGTAEVPVQIDVGAGDVVTPAPERATFPALLDFPAPQIRTYPVYTVVAEKFEAMVKLGIANTRMKDFHDIWFLAQRFEFDGPTLRKAIDATSARRQTNLPPIPKSLPEAFANDPTKQVQWSASLRRNGLTGVPERFSEVVDVLRKFFEPVLRLRRGRPHRGNHQSGPLLWIADVKSPRRTAAQNLYTKFLGSGHIFQVWIRRLFSRVLRNSESAPSFWPREFDRYSQPRFPACVRCGIFRSIRVVSAGGACARRSS